MTEEQQQVIKDVVALLSKAQRDYNSGTFNDIGRLNIVAHVGERLVFGADTVIDALNAALPQPVGA